LTDTEKGVKTPEEVFDDKAVEFYSRVQARGGTVAGEFKEAAQ
jgi:hypothetical protein